MSLVSASAVGGGEAIMPGDSTYNTSTPQKQNTQCGTPRYNHPRGTQRKAGQKNQKSGKNRAPPDKERVLGTGPRTREEARSGERAMRARPDGGHVYLNVLYRLTFARAGVEGAILECCVLRSALRLCRPQAGSPRWGRARTGTPRPVHP